MQNKSDVQKRIVKFNLYASCSILVILILMFIGVTIAYFFDSKQVTNTFTSGNVKLALSEAGVKPDAAGNLIEDTSVARIFGGTDEVVNNYGRIYPKQTIFKDPTITNTGDIPEWIAAKITINDGAGDLTKIMGYEGYEDIDIELLLTGGLLDEDVHVGTWNGIHDVCYNDRYAMVQVPNARESKFEFYFFMLKPLEVADSVVVFDHLSFPDEWDNDEMQELADLEIKVQAFGSQTFQFDSCVEAMTEAFPEQFTLNLN